MDFLYLDLDPGNGITGFFHILGGGFHIGHIFFNPAFFRLGVQERKQGKVAGSFFQDAFLLIQGQGKVLEGFLKGFHLTHGLILGCNGFFQGLLLVRCRKIDKLGGAENHQEDGTGCQHGPVPSG